MAPHTYSSLLIRCKRHKVSQNKINIKHKEDTHLFFYSEQYKYCFTILEILSYL